MERFESGFWSLNLNILRNVHLKVSTVKLEKWDLKEAGLGDMLQEGLRSGEGYSIKSECRLELRVVSTLNGEARVRGPVKAAVKKQRGKSGHSCM